MSTSLVMAILAMVSACIAAWPFGPYQFSLHVARRLHRFPDLPGAQAHGDGLSFAVCLCVYNEATVIDEKVRDLLRMRAAAGGQLEILVYVDGATDGTADLLREYEDHITLHISPARRGKTHGMNILVSLTVADIVIFTDANVLITSEAVSILKRYFADGSIGCVCSDLHYVNARSSATSAVGATYWRFNEWSKSLETATGSVIGADGSCFAIRRRLHSAVPRGLFDDLFVSLSVLLAGYRVVRAPELLAWETHTTAPRDELRRKIRIACECMHVHLALWPNLRRLDAWHLYKYLGHRVIRWINGYILLFAALCAALWVVGIVGPAWFLVMAGAVALAYSITYRLGFRISLLIWNVFLAFLGNAIGVWRAVRGERAVTWDVPESSRRLEPTR